MRVSTGCVLQPKIVGLVLESAEKHFKVHRQVVANNISFGILGDWCLKIEFLIIVTHNHGRLLVSLFGRPQPAVVPGCIVVLVWQLLNTLAHRRWRVP